MLAIFLETLNITAPVFAMLFLGVLLKRIDWINDNFIHTASSLVFNVTMPALLFLGILHADLHAALQPSLLIYFSLATLVSFALAWGWAIFRCPREDRGIYTQGAFRGNNGVIGLALAASMYGDYGISLGAILAALVILFYNTLSTIVLAVYSPVEHLQKRVQQSTDHQRDCGGAVCLFQDCFAGLAGDIRPVSGTDHLTAGADLHWRHAVAGSVAQERQHGAQFESGEDGRFAGAGDAGGVVVGFSRGGAGDSVSVLRQPDGGGEFCHGAGSARQS
jgi:hypothetical protein